MARNCFLFLAALVFSLALVEGMLRLYPGQLQLGRKYFLNNNTKDHPRYANCYSSRPQDGFNVQLNAKRSCVFMRDKYDLSLSLLTELAEKAPFCIDYDILHRREGFFPERGKALFIVGDSFAFGEGVPDEGTLAYILSEKLPAYNVRTFAQSAASIEHVARQVAFILANHTSPRILYFLNLNDPLHSRALSGEQRLIADFQNLRPERIQSAGRFWQFWERLRCVKLIRQAWVLSREKRLTIRYYHRLYFSDDNRQEINETFSMLGRMNESVKRAGGNFVLVIYPLIHKDFWGHYLFQDIHDEIKKYCVQNHITCFDGSGAFKQYRSMKPFRVHAVDYHPSARANKTLIDYLVGRAKLSEYLGEGGG